MTGNPIEHRGHIVGFQEKIDEAAKTSGDAFFGWFNNDRETDTAFVNGSWDFSCHIAWPIARWLKDPGSRTALEIGHGGGRILAAAARHFGQVIGVDIHGQNDLVSGGLQGRGVTNFRLIRGDGKTIPLPDDSVDVVYSFIVMQHVERMEILRAYFREARRVMKQDGVGVLYFGRRATWSLNRGSRFRFWMDCLVEPIRLPHGYLELPAAVNSTNLVLTRGCAKKLAREVGFEVVASLVSHKKVPNGIALYGGQHGLVVRAGKDRDRP